MHFLIGRTDNIGDVILTFPLIAKLKEYYPESRVTMLARNYTKDMVERCVDIDHFLSIEVLKEKSEPERIAYLQSLNFDVFLPIQPDRDQTIWARKAEIPVRH